MPFISVYPTLKKQGSSKGKFVIVLYLLGAINGKTWLGVPLPGKVSKGNI